jgi:hypothetical protein
VRNGTGKHKPTHRIREAESRGLEETGKQEDLKLDSWISELCIQEKRK